MTGRSIWNKFHRAAALGIMLVFAVVKTQADLEARAICAHKAAERCEAQTVPPSQEASSTQLATVKRYDVFEETLTINSSGYANPWEVGSWSWTAIARDRTATLQQQSGPFGVVESFQPGFVRRHSQNPFRLAFENGKLFPAIGLGDCIPDYDHSGSPFDNWGLDDGFRSGPGGAKGFSPSGKEVTPWHDCSSASDWCC